MIGCVAATSRLRRGAHDCGAPLVIGAAAAHVGVTVEALRYYESEGLIDPARDAAGRRIFEQRDLDALHVMHTMREAGFSMAEVRALLEVKGDEAPQVRVTRARRSSAGSKRMSRGALVRSANPSGSSTPGWPTSIRPGCESPTVGGRTAEPHLHRLGAAYAPAPGHPRAAWFQNRAAT